MKLSLSQMSSKPPLAPPSSSKTTTTFVLENSKEEEVKALFQGRPSLAAARRASSAARGTLSSSSTNASNSSSSATSANVESGSVAGSSGRGTITSLGSSGRASFSGRNSLSASAGSNAPYYPDVRESRDPGLKLLWSGHFTEAERSFEANKKQNPQAYVRWAEVHFLRYWLTGDRRLGEEVVLRFQDAEKACAEAADQVALQLIPALERHAAKQPLMRRMSRRASMTAPSALKSILGIGRDNPGELLPSTLEFKAEKTHLDEWKRLQGLVAMCALLQGGVMMVAHGGYMKGAMCLRRAYQTVQRATNNVESMGDQASALYLVKGAFELFLTTVPPWLLAFLRAIGYTGNVKQGRETLEKVIRESDPVGETHNYSKLVLAAHFLLISQQEYKPDRGLQIKRADEIVSETLTRNPDWLLFRWLRSHILRRLGRPADAAKVVENLSNALTAELANTPSIVFQPRGANEVTSPPPTLSPRSMENVLTKTKSELKEMQQANKKLERELSSKAKGGKEEVKRKMNQIHACEGYRLRFDLASLQFVQRDWGGTLKLLTPLVEPGSSFTARALAYAMLSACCAMRGDIVQAVNWLEEMHMNVDESSPGISRMDTSWLWKVPTLLHRPHKRVLAYELAYLFGYLKWFDADVAGVMREGGKEEASKWLAKTAEDLKSMHEEATVSVVYPEWPTLPEEASEELMAVSLLSGTVAAMRGELDKAEAFFQSVLTNYETKNTKEGVRDDPFHVPYALYELGSLEIRKSNPLKARSHLVKAMKLCKRKDFSFHHTLSFKVAGALRYLSELARPSDLPPDSKEWKTHQDELGTWLGDGSALGGHGPAGASGEGGKEREMISTTIAKLSKFEFKKDMKAGDGVSWQFIVDTHDVGFQVHFEEEEVEEYARHEAGDLVEGFFTAAKAGKLKITWDNSYSKFTEKKVHYSIVFQ